LLLWARHKNHSAAGVGRTHCGTSSSIAGFVRRKEGRSRREKGDKRKRRGTGNDGIHQQTPSLRGKAELFL